MREKIRNRRASERLPIEDDGASYLVTFSRFDDGRLAEIFLDCSKPSSALAVHASDAAVLVSLLLQHGVPPDEIRHSISGPIAKALAVIGASND